MNNKIKQQWIDALLSNQYQQGKCYLRTHDNYFSVLGVLADIAVKKKIGNWSQFSTLDCLLTVPKKHPYRFLLDEERMTEKDIGHAVFFLPNYILNSTSLTFSNALYILQQNDNGLSFAELAEEIDTGFSNNKIIHLSAPSSLSVA
jgi:hypothetical protein